MCAKIEISAWQKVPFGLQFRAMLNLTVAIIAGGQSRRFGSDKTLAPLFGKPLIAWVAEGASTVTDDVLIISKDRGKYAFLKNVRQFEDLYDVQCPLVGLLTAFHHGRYDTVFMISADMPAFPFAALDMMYRAMGSADVVLPFIGDRYYPTAALYHRRTGDIFTEMLKKENYKLVNALHVLDTVVLDREDFAPFDTDGSAFINTNTPEDLRRLEELKKQDG